MFCTGWNDDNITIFYFINVPIYNAFPLATFNSEKLIVCNMDLIAYFF